MDTKLDGEVGGFPEVMIFMIHFFCIMASQPYPSPYVSPLRNQGLIRACERKPMVIKAWLRRRGCWETRLTSHDAVDAWILSSEKTTLSQMSCIQIFGSIWLYLAYPGKCMIISLCCPKKNWGEDLIKTEFSPNGGFAETRKVVIH